jgi:hypothetical protein
VRTYGVADALAATVILVVAVVVFVLAAFIHAVSAAILVPIMEFTRVSRWRRTPGLREVLPGTPAWAEREGRVDAFATAIATLPIDRFDRFEPKGVAKWTAIMHATHGSPRAVDHAVRSASDRITSIIRHRAARERPGAGYDDYTLHRGGAWVLGDPHWEAAERAAGAATVAILLDGFLERGDAAAWAESGARLVS